MKKWLLLIISLLVLSPIQIFAFEAKVIGISDGDTIKVLKKDNQPIKIRLYGIDCPEKKQAFGTKAKKYTSDLVFGKNVEIEQTDIDRYGRIVAKVYLKHLCLNEELVKEGFAWVYPEYYKETKWYDYQNNAKARNKGLWIDPKPIPPWEFRKNQRLKKRKK